jgi:hypothetical protein
VDVILNLPPCTLLCVPQEVRYIDHQAAYRSKSCREEKYVPIHFWKIQPNAPFKSLIFRILDTGIVVMIADIEDR